MTGIEVVGVVDGVLPLLISAAEQYQDVLKALQKVSKVLPGVDAVQTTFGDSEDHLSK